MGREQSVVDGSQKLRAVNVGVVVEVPSASNYEGLAVIKG